VRTAAAGARESGRVLTVMGEENDTEEEESDGPSATGGAPGAAGMGRWRSGAPSVMNHQSWESK
jgi:hypothetical protein